MAIRTIHLTKYYGTKVANDDINIEVKPGSVFALLGPNGAGKSTLIKSLMGLVRPSSGEAFLLGKPINNMEARAQIGFLPEVFKYQDWLSANEVLDLHARLYRMDTRTRAKRITAVLDEVGLVEVRKRRVREYSKGMQQRLGIACALIAQPKLVLLDEPTSALDPIGRRHVREIITSLRDRGTTVFLNSHLLSEVETVSDAAAFIKAGRIVASGSLDELLAKRYEVELAISNPASWTDAAARRIDEVGGKLTSSANSEGLAVYILSVASEAVVPSIAKVAVEAGMEIRRLIPRRLSLEDLFIDLVERD